MLISEHLTTALGFVCVLAHVSGVVRGQICSKANLQVSLVNCAIKNCYRCTIASPSDYATIPVDATAMDLSFSGSTGLVSSSRMPGLVQLRVLDMSLSNLGQSPVIPSGFFSSLGQLELLTIYANVHSSVGFSARLVNGSFSGLTNLTRLTANALGIAELPVGVFDDLVRLKLLNLNQNDLRGVATGVFAQQRRLTAMNLARNQFSSLVNFSFAGLGSVESIDLSGNEIRSLGKGLDFLELRNLTELNLGSNQMVSIDPYAFTGLSRLQKLFLHTNNLTNLTLNAFNDLTSLNNLDLRGNVLRRLSANLFSYLGSLRTLDLSENHLETLPSDLFNGLQNLTALHLQRNWIRSIEDRSFAGLESLETLELADNQITEVDPDAFQSLRRLERLDLASNNLTALELGTTNGFNTKLLSHLDLSRNPWNCSCGNYWLVLWLQLNNLTRIIASPDATICQSPEEWLDRALLVAYDDTNNSCPFPFPVQTTEATAPLAPTGNARTSDEIVLSKEAEIGIIIAAVVVAVIIIVVVAVIVHFRLKRMGFWDRKRSESNGVMHRDAAKNDSAASDSKLRPEVGPDGGYDNRWVIADDGSGQGQGDPRAQYLGSGTGDVGFAILSRAGSPCDLKDRNETNYVYDNPTLVDDGRHI